MVPGGDTQGGDPGEEGGELVFPVLRGMAAVPVAVRRITRRTVVTKIRSGLQVGGGGFRD